MGPWSLERVGEYEEGIRAVDESMGETGKGIAMRMRGSVTGCKRSTELG